MKRFLWLVFVLPLVACGDAFVEEEAYFVGYNVSNSPVVAVINGDQEFSLTANGSARFVVKILVPQPRVNSGPSAPSSVDRMVQVTVAFRDATSGQLTQPIQCQTGAKIVTTIWYEIYAGGRANTRCIYSYAF